MAPPPLSLLNRIPTVARATLLRLLSLLLVASVLLASAAPAQALQSARPQPEKPLYGACAPRCIYPLNCSDPSGLDYTVFGGAAAANKLKYQYEKWTGYKLEYNSSRQLRIVGGRGNGSAAALKLRQVIESSSHTKIRAIDPAKAGSAVGPGEYFTKDNIHNVFPGVIESLASLEEGFGASMLFHETGEAYSRGKFGQSGNRDQDYRRDHRGLAHEFGSSVASKFGITIDGPGSWSYRKGGKHWLVDVTGYSNYVPSGWKKSVIP